MELEIKVMWCKGLATFNFFQKLSVYASVSLTPIDKTLKITLDQKQEQKTPIDQQGDANPEWNSIMKFDLSPPNISSNLHKLALVFEIRNQGQFFGYKEIGQVRVPVKELVESVGVGVGRLVSYEVRGNDGKHNGVLDFSYKVINKAGLGRVQVSDGGYEDQDCCDSGRHDYYSGTEKVQYPKFDHDMGQIPNLNLNPNPIMSSIWEPGSQPQYWAPPPPPPSACCAPPPACCGEQPPPPPPRIMPPPPEQQPYAYQPPPAYGDPYWAAAYHGQPPGYYQQQPTGHGCEYPHW